MPVQIGNTTQVVFFTHKRVIGLDAKDGKVATDGWSKLTGHDVVDLAKTIFADEANPTWTPEKIDEVRASRKTVQADFLKPIPVYIVYFSAAASTDGKIVNYGDVYKRDAKVLAALLDNRPAEGKDVATR